MEPACVSQASTPRGDASIVARGFGFRDSSDTEEIVSRVAATTDPNHLRRALDAAAASDLEAARDEWRALVDLLGAIDAVLSRIVGPFFDRTLLKCLQDRGVVTGSLLVWLPLRTRPAVQAGYVLILEALRAVTRGENPVEALRVLDAQWALLASGEVNFTSKTDGSIRPLKGTFLTIWQRQRDGSWKVHRDIFNEIGPHVVE